MRTLSPLRFKKDVEFYEVTFSPDGALQSATDIKAHENS